MPKRSTEEKIKRYQNKIKKLVCDSSKRRHRRIIVSSDEDEPINNCDENVEDVENITAEIISHVPCESQEFTDPTQMPEKDISEPDLDPEVLLALGESTTDSPDFGAKILESQAKLWAPLLTKGLPKETKDKLLKEYLIPINCKLLQAPKLNAEIAAAIPEMVKNRDKITMVVQQQQLGAGVTAINRAMDILLLNGDRIQAIKHLSNGCRLLTDLHCTFTQNRTKLITPSLDRTCLNVIQDAERDETLFGEKLSENIKSAKAIEKQGLQIKKVLAQKPATTTQRTTSTYRPQGNWQGPPRYPLNRGGRGGNGGNRRPTQTPMTANPRRNTYHPRNVPPKPRARHN